MSVVASVAPTVVPSVTPVVVHTVTQFRDVFVPTTSHWFQLAEIVQYLGLGVGLSLIHAVLNGKFNLPHGLNKVLPVVYSAVTAVAVLVVKGGVNWSDWYEVFVQVLAGAVVVYGLISAYNSTQSQDANLPTVTNV